MVGPGQGRPRPLGAGLLQVRVLQNRQKKGINSGEAQAPVGAGLLQVRVLQNRQKKNMNSGEAQAPVGGRAVTGSSPAK